MAKSHAGSLAAFLSKLTSRYWPLFLVATIILSVLSIPRTIHLFKTISTDPIDLLPTDNPNIQSLLAIRNKLEKGIRVSLIFESEDPATTIKFMKDTSAKLYQATLSYAAQLNAAGDYCAAAHYYANAQRLIVDTATGDTQATAQANCALATPTPDPNATPLPSTETASATPTLTLTP